jgi:hypothetical protein
LAISSLSNSVRVDTNNLLNLHSSRVFSLKEFPPRNNLE